MVDSYIALPADDVGKKLRTTEVTVGLNDVHEEVIQLANSADVIIDPATNGALTTINTTLTTGITANVVQVTNPWTVNLITGFSTSTKQSDGSQKTQVVDENGNNLKDSAILKQRMEYSGTSLLYLGEAVAGTAEGTTAWRIRKFTYDGNGLTLSVDWADGVNTFTKSWTARATYAYS